jgi:AcrR family transcriptional regulator
MLGEMPVAELSLNELSRRVGLAKSNVLRYFESREAVLFQLLERAMDDWLAEVPDELAAAVDPSGSARERGDRVAAVLGASLARQTVLLDLVNAQTSVLEHNVSVDAVVRHKRSALANLAAAADLLRRYVPELGDGAPDVAMLTLIVAGTLSTYCRPSPSALAAYEADPAVAVLRLDLRATLEQTIATLIAGTLARS